MVKVGYKQTEVGVIPDDWVVSRVDEACRLINGRGFKPHEWEEIGLPIIRIQNLNGAGEFNYFRGDYDPKIEVKNGQLLFAWSGSRGTSFGPHIWHGELGLLNYHTWKMVPKGEKVDPTFFYVALKELTRSIEDKAHGASALVHTQKWEMEGYEFPHPSERVEQKAIAGALSDVDGLIAGLEALIAKKRNLKTATMQQLLTGKTRLPGFGEGVGMKETELGEIPEDWEVKTLGKLAEMKSGAGITSASISDAAEYPCFGGNGLRGFTYTKTHSGDFPLIGRQGAHCGNIQFASGEFFASEHAIVLTSKPNVVPLWLNYILTTRDLNRLSESSAQPGLSVTKLRALTYHYPTDEDEQKAIADIIQDIELDVDGIETRIGKTKALKQGMMQELLTGRTRLI